MSHNEPIVQEFKTIRLPARTYYKILELSSLIALVRGESTSISEVTATLIDTYYQFLFPWFLNIVNDPKQLDKVRNEAQAQRKTLAELMKDIKLTE